MSDYLNRNEIAKSKNLTVNAVKKLLVEAGVVQGGGRTPTQQAVMERLAITKYDRKHGCYYPRFDAARVAKIIADGEAVKERPFQNLANNLDEREHTLQTAQANGISALSVDEESVLKSGFLIDLENEGPMNHIAAIININAHTAQFPDTDFTQYNRAEPVAMRYDDEIGAILLIYALENESINDFYCRYIGQHAIIEDGHLIQKNLCTAHIEGRLNASAREIRDNEAVAFNYHDPVRERLIHMGVVKGTGENFFETIDELSETATHAAVYVDENGHYKISELDPNTISESFKTLNFADTYLQSNGILLYSQFDDITNLFAKIMGKLFKDSNGGAGGQAICESLLRSNMAISVYETRNDEIIGMDLISRNKDETLRQCIQRSIRNVIVNGATERHFLIDEEKGYKEHLEIFPQDINPLLDAAGDKGLYLAAIVMNLDAADDTTDFSLLMRRAAMELRVKSPRDYSLMLLNPNQEMDEDGEYLDNDDDDENNDLIKYIHIPIYQKTTVTYTRLRKYVAFAVQKYRPISMRLIFIDLESRRTGTVEAFEEGGVGFRDVSGVSLNLLGKERIAVQPRGQTKREFYPGEIHSAPQQF